MNRIIITKVFRNGKIQISSRVICPGTSITSFIDNLEQMIKGGALCSYEIEIVNENN